MPPSTNLHNKRRQKSTCTTSAILADELLGMTTLSSKARFRGARFPEARVGTKRRHDADVVGPRCAHIRRILNNVELRICPHGGIALFGGDASARRVGSASPESRVSGGNTRPRQQQIVPSIASMPTAGVPTPARGTAAAQNVFAAEPAWEMEPGLDVYAPAPPTETIAASPLCEKGLTD